MTTSIQHQDFGIMCAKIARAIDLLNSARDMLESLPGTLLSDAVDDIGPILLSLEEWQRNSEVV